MLLLFADEYWSNAQYCLRLQVPDRSVFARCSDANANKCEVVVSLMQKHSRRNRTVYRVHSAEIAMTFDLYRVQRRFVIISTVDWLDRNE